MSMFTCGRRHAARAGAVVRGGGGGQPPAAHPQPVWLRGVGGDPGAPRHPGLGYVHTATPAAPAHVGHLAKPAAPVPVRAEALR